MEEASVKFDRSHLHEVALHISKQAEILLTSTHPNRDINLDKYGFPLILSIYEQFNASLTLLNSHNPQYSGAIIRGMQECLVNLKCLVKDPLFINNLFHDDAVANKQAIEASLKLSTDDPEFRFANKVFLDGVVTIVYGIFIIQLLRIMYIMLNCKCTWFYLNLHFRYLPLLDTSALLLRYLFHW